MVLRLFRVINTSAQANHWTAITLLRIAKWAHVAALAFRPELFLPFSPEARTVLFAVLLFPNRAALGKLVAHELNG